MEEKKDSKNQVFSILSSSTKTKSKFYKGSIHSDIDYTVDLESIRQRNKILTQRKIKKANAKINNGVRGEEDQDQDSKSMSITRTNIAKEDELTSTARLAHIISKEDFQRMDVLGQFNLGFIIARLRTPETQELFIIDQHAR